MFFLTVYGPELESLFLYINRFTEATREEIYAAYLPQLSHIQKGQTKNIEDALGFLKAAHLIEGDKRYSSCIQKESLSLPFPILLLRQFRQLERISSQLPLLDLLYIRLLNDLFIKPNQIWVSDLHTAVNQLDLAKQAGGVSQEKIGAWKRVMEFLGVGYRVGSGFYCIYRPELVYAIIQQWPEVEGSLQDFFEKHMHRWIPCLTAKSEIAFSVSYTLDWLAKSGSLSLFPKQDSPSRPYFGDRHLKGIHLYE
ncbi:MAG TPA: hypothetical protein VFV38_17235 [Ktedonobacteraceae bacterium]|nr:hypothetical protein [Ktedonobacteraceae bacterium]